MFCGCEKVEKTFSFVIFSYFNKGSAFTQLKTQKGYRVLNYICERGIPFANIKDI